MLQGLPTDSRLPTAALALSCARRAQADRDSQTTNLGVRSSNLFGRATQTPGNQITIAPFQPLRDVTWRDTQVTENGLRELALSGESPRRLGHARARSRACHFEKGGMKR